MFTWGGTDDLMDTLLHVHQEFPEALKFGVGFSMGANILAKLVGEYPQVEHHLVSAISISQGYEGERGMEFLTTQRQFYDKFLLKKMKNVLIRYV
jgi:predicted alpha/beta-fold hydrolase